jgi:hypothetical protein
MSSTALRHAITVGALLAWPSAPHAKVGDGAGLVHVVTDAPLDSVTVGQRFAVTYRISAPDSLVPVLRDRVDAARCRFVSMSWDDSRAPGRLDRTATVVLIPAALDSVVVPPLAFDFVSPQGDTLRAWSDGFEIPIRRIATASDDPRGLKPQWEVPPDYAKWAALALAGVAAVALVVWWLRRRRARVEAAPEPRLPPDYVALAELERIAAMGLVERGEIKTYYTLVADVVRRYIGERFHVESMDRTTPELLDELAQRRIDADGLAALLREADLVKFAKHRPDVAAARSALDQSRAVVVATTPREAPSPPATVGTGA